MKLLKFKLTETMRILSPTGHFKCPLAVMAAVTDGAELQTPLRCKVLGTPAAGNVRV